MANHIEIYEQNTKLLAVYVSGVADLSIYVPYLTVKRRTSDSAPLLSKAGVISDPSTTCTFSLTVADTSIAAGDYVYDITLEGTSTTITLIKDRFSVLDTVRH